MKEKFNQSKYQIEWKKNNMATVGSQFKKRFYR